MIITNFKTYEQATGDSAIALAQVHDAVAKETGADIRVVVQAMDLARVAASVSIPVMAQHVDGVGFGGNTGHILPESAVSAGAGGTILNHSENRLERDYLRQCIERAKSVGLMVVVCAATPEEGASFLEFDPDFIAVEPPELIGGDISVSSAQPEIIEHAAKLIGPEKLLVGAGVKNGQDVQIAVQLGAQGVLLASGVTKAADPKAVLLDLVSGLKQG